MNERMHNISRKSMLSSSLLVF